MFFTPQEKKDVTSSTAALVSARPILAHCRWYQCIAGRLLRSCSTEITGYVCSNLGIINKQFKITGTLFVHQRALTLKFIPQLKNVQLCTYFDLNFLFFLKCKIFSLKIVAYSMCSC